MRRRRRNPHPLLAALWKGSKAGYHAYRAGRLEEKARAHRRKAVLNPRTGIPGQVVEVRYHRDGKDPGRYVHRFGRNVRIKLGPGRSRVTLYHAKGQPIWADERARDYGKWVALDHRRRVNPRRRAMARRRQQDDNTMLWVLGGVLLYFWMKPGAVSTGGQAILPQDASTVWYSDPNQGGGGEFFQGALPPGAAPPWRLASATEIAFMGEQLAAGGLVAAGGGLIAPNTQLAM
jgi:hypothetical protein